MIRLPSLIWRTFWLILLFAFLTRVFRLNIPEKYYFDEVYHAVTAKLVLHNDPRAYEWWNPPPEPNTAVDWLHPPLAKLTQAASMAVFGENSFGWRFSAALFGTGSVALVFFLGLALGFSTPVTLLAMGLFSLDGLALTTSRIAMNDAHVTFFFLLTLWQYVRWKRQPSDRTAFLVSVAAGLAVASKWSGVFVVGAMGLDQLRLLLLSGKAFQKKLAQAVFLLISLAIVVPSIYILSYSQMFAQGKTWKHFQELHHQTWWYQTHLEATHPYQSTPLEWVLNLRPVYVHADFGQADVLQNIYMFGNPLIFWVGALAVLWTIGDVGAKYWAKKSKSPQVDELSLLLIAYAITWVPWLASPRIMFFYHYLPAVPILCLLLAHQLFAITKGWKDQKIFILAFVGVCAVVFVLFFPNLTALPVPQVWSRLFFLLPRWR